MPVMLRFLQLTHFLLTMSVHTEGALKLIILINTIVYKFLFSKYQPLVSRVQELMQFLVLAESKNMGLLHSVQKFQATHLLQNVILPPVKLQSTQTLFILSYQTLGAFQNKI